MLQTEHSNNIHIATNRTFKQYACCYKHRKFKHTVATNTELSKTLLSLLSAEYSTNWREFMAPSPTSEWAENFEVRPTRRHSSNSTRPSLLSLASLYHRTSRQSIWGRTFSHLFANSTEVIIVHLHFSYLLLIINDHSQSSYNYLLISNDRSHSSFSLVKSYSCYLHVNSQW